MPSPLHNFRKLLEERRAGAVEDYLVRRGEQHIREFPQMCCYSFDWTAVQLAVHGRYDRLQLDWVLRVLGPTISGRTVVDVGANIGNHSAAFAPVAAEVIALEPHPITFQLLQLNLARYPNVTLLQLGASDSKGNVRALAPQRNFGEASITDRPPLDGESEWFFDVAPLDEQELIRSSDVALVKVDVEGHEAAVLRGASELLRSKRPIILIEQHADVVSDGTSESFELMKAFGYRHFYSLTRERPWRTPRRLARPLRMGLMLGESIVYGPAELQPILRPVERLEKQSYPMLIASFEPIPAGHSGR